MSLDYVFFFWVTQPNLSSIFRCQFQLSRPIPISPSTLPLFASIRLQSEFDFEANPLNFDASSNLLFQTRPDYFLRRFFLGERPNFLAAGFLGFQPRLQQMAEDRKRTLETAVVWTKKREKDWPKERALCLRGLGT